MQPLFELTVARPQPKCSAAFQHRRQLSADSVLAELSPCRTQSSPNSVLAEQPRCAQQGFKVFGLERMPVLFVGAGFLLRADPVR